jgi:hypothetical protein
MQNVNAMKTNERCLSVTLIDLDWKECEYVEQFNKNK